MMLVSDHEKMIKEARRVLKSGKKAAFTTWGRRKNFKWYNMITDACVEVGLPAYEPPKTGFTHSEDLDKLN